MTALASYYANHRMKSGWRMGLKLGCWGEVHKCVCVFILNFLCGCCIPVCVFMRRLKRLDPSLARVTREDPSVVCSHCREASSFVSHLHCPCPAQGISSFSFHFPSLLFAPSRESASSQQPLMQTMEQSI